MAYENPDHGLIELYNCTRCGVLVGIAAGHASTLYRQRRDFFCPNGHRFGWRYMREKSDKRRTPQDEPSAEEIEARRQRVKLLHDQEQAEAKAADLVAKASPSQPEAGGAATVQAPAKRKQTMPDDGKRVVCNHCGKRFAIVGRCLESHLICEHGIRRPARGSAQYLEWEKVNITVIPAKRIGSKTGGAASESNGRE